VLIYNVGDKFVPKLEYLENRLSMSPADVRSIFLAKPDFIGTDLVKNMDPTITFFESLLGPERGLRLLRSNITFIRCSLVNRLIPRRDMINELGIYLFNESMVAVMCTKTDTQFVAWLNKFAGVNYEEHFIEEASEKDVILARVRDRDRLDSDHRWGRGGPEEW
jgi:hypothetical protein